MYTVSVFFPRLCRGRWPCEACRTACWLIAFDRSTRPTVGNQLYKFSRPQSAYLWRHATRKGVEVKKKILQVG
jgi:hypothetical protein